MDETYIKVKGVWNYLYRAVDKEGNTIDFMLSKHRDEAAAKAFPTKAIRSGGLPEKITIDKSGANKAGIETINLQLILLIRMSFYRRIFLQLSSSFFDKALILLLNIVNLLSKLFVTSAFFL